MKLTSRAEPDHPMPATAHVQEHIPLLCEWDEMFPRSLLLILTERHQITLNTTSVCIDLRAQDRVTATSNSDHCNTPTDVKIAVLKSSLQFLLHLQHLGQGERLLTHKNKRPKSR